MSRTTRAGAARKFSVVPSSEEAARIERIRRRMTDGPAYISVERAAAYTKSWRATERGNVPTAVRVARAMKNVYENINHYIDPDDRIAGYWTEKFLGVPIDIERGVFNNVLESELTKKDMIRFRAGATARGVRYMLRNRTLGEFVKNQRIVRAAGSPPLNFSLETMSERKINRYHIEDADLNLLRKKLLPYWKGRTVVDEVERRVVEAGLYSESMHDFATAIPGNTSRQVIMLSTAATIGSYQGHVILDYSEVLSVGLEKMKAKIDARLKRTRKPEKRAFLESISIALEGVMIYSDRLADRLDEAAAAEVDTDQQNHYEQMAARVRRVPRKPAANFREAVQAMWTVKTAVELAHPVNLHCFGRLDQQLAPYYRADLKSGAIDAESARTLLAELLLKVMSQNVRPESNILGNYYHRFLGSTPITIGGLDADGADASNELTELFIEAGELARAVTNISLRVSEKTPDRVLLKMSEALKSGASCYSIFNDEINIPALESYGFSNADAHDYAIVGCVETIVPGKTGGMSANALLLNRLLDMTLRNGDSKLLAGTIAGEGLRTGAPDRFDSFDQLLDALVAQAVRLIDKIVSGSNLRDRVFSEFAPAPYISAFIDGCAENTRDITSGGARYDFSGISTINSIANMIDSLYVIKKLVYEQKLFTVAELLDALDENFVTRPDIDRAIADLPGKWGNGHAETDRLAADIAGRLFAEVRKHRTFKNGPFVVYVISMITHTIDGRLSIASPDGRRAAAPYAASCNPYNVEQEGITATMRSIAALPFEHVLGAAVNMKFHPSALGSTPRTAAKWIALIRAYFKMGGTQLQPTVASAEVLREAKADPKKHRDLIVKVGGYSTYFHDLGDEIQNEVIARTERRL